MTEHEYSRRKVLLDTCIQWYRENPESAQMVANILLRKATGTSQRVISLRLIEFFLHTFVRQHAGEEFGELNGHEITYSYQKSTKSFGKGNFDLFCRNEKARFQIGDIEIMSNGSQLEFFRWAISTGVLEIIENNITRIIAEKQKFNQNQNQNPNPRRKQDNPKPHQKRPFRDERRSLM